MIFVLVKIPHILLPKIAFWGKCVFFSFFGVFEQFKKVFKFEINFQISFCLLLFALITKKQKYNNFRFFTPVKMDNKVGGTEYFFHVKKPYILRPKKNIEKKKKVFTYFIFTTFKISSTS